MKKVITVALAMTLALSLISCGTTTETTTEDTYTIAIVKQLDHASMDEIAVATELQLTENLDNVEVLQYSGQNDSSTLAQIGAELVADGVDLIIPVGTLAAQQIIVAAEETDIPIVYTGVADPELGGLVDIPNVTGVSHNVETSLVLDMMMTLQPDVQTVALLYSTSQVNSITPVEEAKEYLDARGISYIEKTGNTSDEIIAAVSSCIGQVDAIFTPTDNVVMAAELSIADMMADAGIPHYTPADSFARNGAFAALGVSFTEVGYMTADMAMDILAGGDIGDYYKMEGEIITVNIETAATLGMDYSALQDLTSIPIDEVETTVE